MKNKVFIHIAFVAIFILLIAGGVRIYLESLYQKGVIAQEAKDYNDAIELFNKITWFRDSEIRCKNVENLKKLESQNAKNYDKALALYHNERYSDAMKLFKNLKDYKASNAYKKKCEDEIKQIKQNAYVLAYSKYESGEFYEAMTLFKVLGKYKSSELYIKRCYESLKPKYSTKYSVEGVDTVTIRKE